MQPPAAQTEMLDDVEDLHRLFHISHLRLLGDDQVNVHVGVDEVAVDAPAHRPFDPHEAVFLDRMFTRDRMQLKLVQLADVEMSVEDLTRVCVFMLHLGPLEYSFWVECLGLSWVILVCLDPTDVLTPPEAPFPQTLKVWHRSNYCAEGC